MGTLGYMSPEQILGGDIDQRTDIFAVGVMIVKALGGRRPFEGGTPAEISRAVLRDEVHVPQATGDAAALDQVVQGCLAKNASGRFTSAEALRRELIPALRSWPGPAALLH